MVGATYRSKKPLVCQVRVLSELPFTLRRWKYSLTTSLTTWVFQCFRWWHGMMRHGLTWIFCIANRRFLARDEQKVFAEMTGNVYTIFSLSSPPLTTPPLYPTAPSHPSYSTGREKSHHWTSVIPSHLFLRRSIRHSPTPVPPAPLRTTAQSLCSLPLLLLLFILLLALLPLLALLALLLVPLLAALPSR